MSYREVPPAAPLARHVACTWAQAVDAAHAHLVVPDACADLICIDGGPPLLVGPATRAIEHVLPAGTHVAGVRFRTASIAHALGVPAAALLDATVPAAELWGRDPALADALAAAAPARRAALLERAVHARLRAREVGAGDPIVEHAVAWLARRPTGAMARLARELGYTERQVLRRVRAATGYAPKLLQRVFRFQRVLLELARARSGELARIAAAAGYADQAHLTRETRELAGVAPAALVGRAGIATPAMSEMFKSLGPPRRSLRA